MELLVAFTVRRMTMTQRTQRSGLAVVATLLFQVLVLNSVAQLGMDEKACNTRFGVPVMVQGTSNDVLTLTFMVSNAFVEVSFCEGVACRIVYHGGAIGSNDVERILADSAGGRQWYKWTPPGRQSASGTVKRWFRSDKQAFAELGEDVFTVTGGGWSTRPTESASTTNEVSTAVQKPALSPGSTNTVVDGTVVTVAPGPRQPDVAKIEPPKPKPPAQLPAKGDTKDDVLRLLGKPTGTMVMKGIEILVYPWGRIWIKDGKVLSVE